MRYVRTSFQNFNAFLDKKANAGCLSGGNDTPWQKLKNMAGSVVQILLLLM